MSCLSKGLLRSSAMLSILLALTAGSVGLPSRAFALSELKPAQNTESEPKAENGAEPQQPQPPEPDEPPRAPPPSPGSVLSTTRINSSYRTGLLR